MGLFNRTTADVPVPTTIRDLEPAPAPADVYGQLAPSDAKLEEVAAALDHFAVSTLREALREVDPRITGRVYQKLREIRALCR